MSEFYDNLDEYTKKVFDILKYRPKDDYDANKFIRTYYKLDEVKDISVNFKKPIIFKGKFIKVVKITSQQPFMACAPKVWEKMKAQEKLYTITMIYNFLTNKMIGDKKKPSLMFFTEYRFEESTNAACCFEKNYVYLPLKLILTTNNCITLTGMLVHELQHFRQEYERHNLYDWLNQNEFDFAKLTTYQKHLFFKCTCHISGSIDNLYNFRSEQLYEKMIATSNLTKENIDLWLRLEKEKDSNWFLIKHIAYDFNDQEIEAQDIETKSLQILYDHYMKSTLYKNIIFVVKRNRDVRLLQDAGFEMDDTAVTNIANVGNLANMVDLKNDTVYYDALNYLLEIYKAKKVDKSFVDNYDEVEKAFFREQQKFLLKQREKKMLNKGSEINEL